MAAEIWSSATPLSLMSSNSRPAIRMGIINYVRGERNYIHSTDMIDALPLDTRPEQLSIFLRKPSTHPGFWSKSGSTGLDPERYEKTASLTLKFPTHRERWDFLIDKEGRFEKRLPDFKEDAHVYAIDLESEPPCCKVTCEESESVWVAIMAAMREVGKTLYPETNGWYIAYIHSNMNYLDPALSGSVITMRLGKKREFLEIDFDIGCKPTGRIGFIQS